MRIRTGFVSNSSSSSFILSIAKEQECKHCNQSNADVLNIIRDLFSSKKYEDYVPKTFSGNPEDYLVSIDTEIEEINKDIHWAHKKIQVLEKINKNPDAVCLMKQWDRIKEEQGRDKGINFLRYGREDDKYRNENEIDTIARDLDWKRTSIKTLEKKRAELENKKSKIEKAINGEEQIYILEVNHMDDAHTLIQNMINNGSVKLIDKVTI
jgi:hypothetical protein